MPNRDCSGLAAVLLIGAGVLPGFAQTVEPGREGPLADIVQPTDGARACYSRVYDAAHLKAHPHQQITEMSFRLAYYIHDPDETYPKGQRNYYFELAAKRRGDSRRLTAGGECAPTETGSIFCGVECDGGGVGLAASGKHKVLVDLEAAGRLRMTLSCGGDEEGEGVVLEPGRDDKTFLLGRVADADCPNYEDW